MAKRKKATKRLTEPERPERVFPDKCCHHCWLFAARERDRHGVCRRVAPFAPVQRGADWCSFFSRTEPSG